MFLFYKNRSNNLYPNKCFLKLLAERFCNIAAQELACTRRFTCILSTWDDLSSSLFIAVALWTVQKKYELIKQRTERPSYSWGMLLYIKSHKFQELFMVMKRFTIDWINSASPIKMHMWYMFYELLDGVFTTSPSYVNE